MKTYHLTAPDGTTYESTEPGKLGGNSRDKIYGHLECGSANAALPGYAKIRVFFANEDAAITAGYRPCGNCMRKTQYKDWKVGGRPATKAYPWKVVPK